MRTRLALLLAMSVAAQAQDDAKELLLRVSQRVMEAVNRLPKYICTLTIDRAEYKTNGIVEAHSCDKLAAEKEAGHLKRRLFASDRLRLDVAIGKTQEIFGATNEMYSWVGENRFDNRGLLDLVQQGAISTGAFSTLLVTIFGEDRATFSYNGDLTVDGRMLSEFGFRIPVEKSNYLYLFGRDRRRQLRTAAEGTFLVDSKTLELVRLTVRHALPPEADACETSQTLDYGRVTLGGSDFLLATEGRLDILSLADEMENHMAFSACHEFTGQSTLSFEPPPEPSGSATGSSDPAIPISALPPGLAFKLAFIDPIDTAVAAAGDPIRAKLTAPIRARSSGVLVPEGASVSARIVKAEHLFAENKSFVLAVKLESVVIGGTVWPLKAAPDYGVRRFAKRPGLTHRISLGLLNASQDPDVGIFDFPGAAQNYVIKGGYASNWQTLAP